MGIKKTGSNDAIGDITKAQVINLLKKKQNIIKTTVADETEMLALTGLVIYDIVKRADLNNALFQLISLPESNIANWVQISSVDNTGTPTQAFLTIISNNQTIFALPFLPKTPNITTLFLSGCALRYGVDYTIVGSTLTYINSEMPLKTDYELYGIFYI